jgi:hypothetical protein
LQRLNTNIGLNCVMGSFSWAQQRVPFAKHNHYQWVLSNPLL